MGRSIRPILDLITWRRSLSNLDESSVSVRVK
jgi:hypothetical protein